MTDNTNVNVAPAQTPQWVNADGLRVKFGKGEAELGYAGEYETDTSERMLEFFVHWSVVALGTDDTHSVILDYQTVIPEDAIITRAEFYVTEAWDSTSNDVALNFGTLTIPAAGSTAYAIVDADGIMNTVAKTVIDLAGNRVAVIAAGSDPTSTYTGALLGAVSSASANSVVSAYWENHAPTQGAGYLRVWYLPELKVEL
jgi:hypothetical protein